ncbi:MAG TPA: Holliday junction branch migration protein RuvA [Candidatus Paceibacterota bacterium]|jgi:Holliday junction DNA helicase RuvA|nr:Holliday junction branch migration protein RuvA [Candidatus Paceibacterota bacterium]
MIGKLTGTWGGNDDGVGLVEVGGVGYAVRVPFYTLTTAPGTAVSLYIHTVVREDALDLYGFVSHDELSFFKQLTSVSGVGPKTALGVLNVSDIKSLKRSIASGDASALTKVFGIGKKSAERIVVELRDKLSLEQSTRPHEADTTSGHDGEVIEALMALGYRADESRQALRAIGAVGQDNIKERLGAALKRLGSRAS